MRIYIDIEQWSALQQHVMHEFSGCLEFNIPATADISEFVRIEK